MSRPHAEKEHKAKENLIKSIHKWFKICKEIISQVSVIYYLAYRNNTDNVRFVKWARTIHVIISCNQLQSNLCNRPYQYASLENRKHRGSHNSLGYPYLAAKPSQNDRFSQVWKFIFQLPEVSFWKEALYPFQSQIMFTMGIYISIIVKSGRS